MGLRDFLKSGLKAGQQVESTVMGNPPQTLLQSAKEWLGNVFDKVLEGGRSLANNLTPEIKVEAAQAPQPAPQQQRKSFLGVFGSRTPRGP